MHILFKTKVTLLLTMSEPFNLVLPHVVSHSMTMLTVCSGLYDSHITKEVNLLLH